jgi:uncharacterized membrane protein
MNQQNDGDTNLRTERNYENVLGRIISLSDGIFAFAITLLILNVVVPDGVTNQGLPAAMVALWPKYLAFLISFVVIGAYWVNHVRQLRVLRKYDKGLLWLNLSFLLFIVMIPFSTSVLSSFYGSLTTIVYAANIAGAGYMSTILWAYATYKHRLVNANLGSGQVKRGIILHLISPVVFTLSIGIALVDNRAAQYSWISIVVFSALAPKVFKLPGDDEN